MAAPPDAAGPNPAVEDVDLVDTGVVAPAKVIRLVHLLRATHDELRTVALDDAARAHLLQTHRALVIELASAVTADEVDEMVALGMSPLPDGSGDVELRLAQAQLLGWARGAAAGFLVPPGADA
jgi:hypothetical protein